MSSTTRTWRRFVKTVKASSSAFSTTSSQSTAQRSFRTVRPSGGDDGSREPLLLTGGQVLWMAVTLALLFTLDLFSVRLYFVVSFIGLLINRLLFAPVEGTHRWWRVVNVITWLCFVVLGFVIYSRIEFPIA